MQSGIKRAWNFIFAGILSSLTKWSRMEVESEILACSLCIPCSGPKNSKCPRSRCQQRPADIPSLRGGLIHEAGELGTLLRLRRNLFPRFCHLFLVKMVLLLSVTFLIRGLAQKGVPHQNAYVKGVSYTEALQANIWTKGFAKRRLILDIRLIVSTASVELLIQYRTLTQKNKGMLLDTTSRLWQIDMVATIKGP